MSLSVESPYPAIWSGDNVIWQGTARPSADTTDETSVGYLVENDFAVPLLLLYNTLKFPSSIQIVDPIALIKTLDSRG